MTHDFVPLARVHEMVPGFDTQTGHAYGSFLLGAVASSNRIVQMANPWYYQNNYDFYVQDDYKVSSKLTFNLGARWQILPGMTERNGYITNLDLTLPNTAAGNRPGALRFADQEGKKPSSIRITGSSSRGWALRMPCRRRWPSAGATARATVRRSPTPTARTSSR